MKLLFLLLLFTFIFGCSNKSEEGLIDLAAQAGQDNEEESTPATIAITASPIINIANVGTYTVSGTCSPDGTDIIDLDVGGEVATAIDCAGGVFSHTYDVSGADDDIALEISANYNATVVVTDTTDVLKDVIAPTGLTQTALADSATVTDRALATLSGACETDAVVKVTGDIDADQGPFEFTCAASAWSLDVALSRAAGAKNINYDQVDAAGNPQAASIDHSYTFNMQPTLVQNKVSVGYETSCFLHTDGKILCTGDLGNGKTGTDIDGFNLFKPYVIDMSAHADSNDFQMLATGYRSSCGIHTNGKVYCWGDNSGGEVGQGDTSDETTPVEIDMSLAGVTNDFSYISLAKTTYAHGCGVHTNEKIYCWGRQEEGALGNRVDSSSVSKPVELDMAGTTFTNSFTSVVAGRNFSCGIHTTGRMFCWGYNSSGQLGNSSLVDSLTPVQVDMSAHGLIDNDFVTASAGESYVCGIHSSGRLYCWGDDEGSFGVLGQGVLGDISAPSEIDMTGLGLVNNFKFISAGGTHTCVIHDNDKAYCWGGNDSGQLGLGNFTEDITLPEELKVSHIPMTNNFKQIATSLADTTCALHSSDDFYCAGNNTGGALGNAAVDYVSDFTEIDMSAHAEDNDFNIISVGIETTCGIHDSGKAFCWGYGNYGVLGNASGSEANTPVEIDMQYSGGDDNDFSDISVSAHHTCAVHTTSTKAYCWGRGANGRLGNGGTSNKSVPDEMDMSAHVESNAFSTIEAGYQGGCAIHTNGKLFCWGMNEYGSVGDGTTTERQSPVEVDMSAHGDDNNFSKVSGTNGNMCAIHATSDKLYCWGDKWGGAVGDGLMTGTQTTPLEMGMAATGVANTFVTVEVSMGGGCAIHTNNKVYCWGYGPSVGNGVSTNTAELLAEIDMSAFAETNNFTKLSDPGFQSSHWINCGIHNSGKLFCWGDASKHKWGITPAYAEDIGKASEGETPYEMEFTNEGLSNDIVEAAGADSSTCIIYDDAGSNKVYCTGNNNMGQIGNGASPYYNELEPVDMSEF